MTNAATSWHRSLMQRTVEELATSRGPSSLLLNTSSSPESAISDQLEVTGPKWNHPLLGVLLITMTLITIFGNTLVICAVIRERCLKSVTYYFIVSLAVADLIVGLFVMPLNSLNKMTNNFWFFGDVWLVVYGYIRLFNNFEALNLTQFSFDNIKGFVQLSQISLKLFYGL